MGICRSRQWLVSANGGLNDDERASLFDSDSDSVPSGTDAAALPAAVLPQPRIRGLRDRLVVRWYCVWHLRGATFDVRGVHQGTISAWHQITQHIPGGHYRSGSDRLRRYGSLQEAIDAFYGEAQRHGARLPVRLYQWP